MFFIIFVVAMVNKRPSLPASPKDYSYLAAIKFWSSMYAIGYDIGSSSVKAALVEIATGKVAARLQEPATEMSMDAPQPGWAEQSPESWWEYLCAATHRLLAETAVAPEAIQSVGISYQMHGLVLVDERMEVVRPAIIWCDSRAIDYGEAAYNAIGADACLAHCLNSPGNFTAAKLQWVKENEPMAYARARYAMLPGDFIALRLSGEASTTVGGLSEGILWDFKQHSPALQVLEQMGLDAEKLPPIVPTIGKQARLSAAAAAACGLAEGTCIGYRAGDQPNNALSLNVLEPGEIAATAGTSGVVYGVSDQLVSDKNQRINSFAHVNHIAPAPRVGVLLCINGAGILHRWVRLHIGDGQHSYNEIENLAAQAPIGADGLSFLPFGNGAERMLNNQQVGAQILHLDFNRHEQKHLLRAGIEGIAFAFVYGMRLMRDLGMEMKTIRVGNDNLFQSNIFATIIATLTAANIEVYNTTGAVGAAMAGAAGAGYISDLATAMRRQEMQHRLLPDPSLAVALETAYARWEKALKHNMEQR